MFSVECAAEPLGQSSAPSHFSQLQQHQQPAKQRDEVNGNHSREMASNYSGDIVSALQWAVKRTAERSLGPPASRSLQAATRRPSGYKDDV